MFRGLTPRQYVQATLKYRQPYFLMYVLHSPLDTDSRTSYPTATWYTRPLRLYSPCTSCISALLLEDRSNIT